jgi:hypothetical protein
LLGCPGNGSAASHEPKEMTAKNVLFSTGESLIFAPDENEAMSHYKERIMSKEKNKERVSEFAKYTEAEKKELERRDTGPFAKFALVKELVAAPYNKDPEELKRMSVVQLIHVAIEEQQKIQMRNPPDSEPWQKTSERIHELAEQLMGKKL